MHKNAANSKRSLVKIKNTPCDDAMEKTTPRFGNDGQQNSEYVVLDFMLNFMLNQRE